MGLDDGEVMPGALLIIRGEKTIQALIQFARRIVRHIQNPLPVRGQIPDDDQPDRQQNRRDGCEVEHALLSIHRSSPRWLWHRSLVLVADGTKIDYRSAPTRAGHLCRSKRIVQIFPRPTRTMGETGTASPTIKAPASASQPPINISPMSILRYYRIMSNIFTEDGIA
jgi:hypothetical protein